jgi:hypothetical protein
MDNGFMAMNTYTTLFIPLLTAHLVGDFVLQSSSDVKYKNRWRVLFKHTGMIALLSYIMIGIGRAWTIGLVILISHALLDGIKTRYRRQGLLSFALDQLAHLAVIWMIAAVSMMADLMPVPSIWATALGRPYYLSCVVLSGAVISVRAGSILIGFAVQPLLRQLKEAGSIYAKEPDEVSNLMERGFVDGGRIIGQLERALIYLFVLVGQPTAIGFLIAAKSVFRFGELSNRANRMEAEYILIGTLYSFLFGILVAYTIGFLLPMI